MRLVASNFDLLARPGFSANYVTCHRTRDKTLLLMNFLLFIVQLPVFLVERCVLVVSSRFLKPFPMCWVIFQYLKKLAIIIYPCRETT